MPPGTPVTDAPRFRRPPASVVQRRLLAGRRNRQPRNARRKSIRRRDERALSKPAVARARARKTVHNPSGCAQHNNDDNNFFRTQLSWGVLRSPREPKERLAARWRPILERARFAESAFGHRERKSS
jgi:hypothetical protein